ncbi:MAG: type II toxin-antitoxin system prevent-host-death family antitoxin [Gammaproteobacteria bacterium]
MTTLAISAASAALTDLPSAPASDLKRLGWRGVMIAVREKGRLLVTNHDEPEAVIISVVEYKALTALLKQAEARTESSLADLRQSFDQRLSVLQSESAGERLRKTLRTGAKLGGKVKAGKTF